MVGVITAPPNTKYLKRKKAFDLKLLTFVVGVGQFSNHLVQELKGC